MMKIAELVRLEESDQGTIGVLIIDREVFCMTLEPPDRNNAPNISSIPAQQYECRRVSSPRFGGTFQVMDVPNRSHVLFHAGNKVKDTSGCILLGSEVGKLKGDRAVLNSGDTFRRFLMAIGDGEFHLTIKEVY